MNDSLTQENLNADISKRIKRQFFKKILLFICIASFIVLLGFLILFFWNRTPFSNLGKKESFFERDPNSQNSSSTRSVFETLATETSIDSGVIGSSTGAPDLFPEIGIGRSVDFVMRNKKVDSEKRPVLNDNEIILEAKGAEEGLVFILIGSKEPFYKHNVGDEVDFVPKISPSDLYVVRDQNILYKSTDIDGYSIPGSIKSGDKVVFTCKDRGCADHFLSWALVFENY